MFKERIKSAAIFILIFNLLFLTSQLWFVNSGSTVSEEFEKYLRSFPFVEKFFPIETEYSISKENLSKPRKFLINDGSLWMAYYNTDIGFSPIDQRTRKIIKGFLQGDITASKEIDSETWESGLESLSIYVEYPVSFSTEMLCRIMGVSTKNVPTEIKSLKELVILPSSEESDVGILVRDSKNPENSYAYVLQNSYTLPASDLSVYTSNDGYYEPVFSTGLELDEESNVSLSPLVLFSDSEPATEVLLPHNLINDKSRGKLLENFSLNSAGINSYEDADGATKYIANYSQAIIYPDSTFEYSAVTANRGILLDESGDSYNVLNAAIDLAEKTWDCVSDEPLSILVSSDLSTYNSDEEYVFKFDYYRNGRPVEINLPAQYGHKKMDCAIEMTVKGGRLISYRQYIRSYETVAQTTISDNFISALDNFVNMLSDSENPVLIEDIYIGYLDTGLDEALNAGWIASTDDGRLHQSINSSEVENP